MSCNTINRNLSEFYERSSMPSYLDQQQPSFMKYFKSSKSGINPDDLKELDFETYEKPQSDGSNITMYKCTYPGCSKEFNRVWGILDHGRTHKGIKPFSCQWCSKTFTQKGNLSKHLKQHFDPSLEQRKRFKCPYCPCKYTEKYNYKLHLKKKHPDRIFEKYSLQNEINEFNYVPFYS